MILHYKISKIETKQFAVFADNLNVNSDVEIGTSFGFNVRNDCEQIRCISKFEYLQEDKLIMLLEIVTYFDIAPDGAERIKEQKSIAVEFLRYMATIVVGTARGIIHSKTENTIINSIILPPVNLVEAITEDFVLEK
jgi:hypothetical protein